MRDLEVLPVANETSVEEGCPACGGTVVARSSHGAAWLYCGACRRLSRSVLVRQPGGGALLLHPLAAA